MGSEASKTKIDVLQNYFAIALRNNVGDLEKMTNAVIASVYHVSEYQEKCPKTTESWCQFQRDTIEGTIFFIKYGLPVDARKAILLIYHDLTKLNFYMGKPKIQTNRLMV